tara:strand:- start:117 stop:908 length:792 start_codon:yes stop_codon:yes gene_type:complete
MTKILLNKGSLGCILVALLFLFGCDDFEYCNDGDACNYNYSSGQGFDIENCIYPTQNSYGYYSGNQSFGNTWDIDSTHYADSLNGGISIYYDCLGNCLLDSDGDGVCDFMDDVFDPNIEVSVLIDIMEANNFEGNPLDFGVQEWIYGELVSLNLSVSGLEIIPNSIGNLTNLESLILSYNEIASIPEEIGNLNQLENIKLDHNQLTSLPSSICNLPSDCVKNLQFNQLCREYHYSCIQMFGGQDQSNCCEGPNGEENWTQCDD